MLAIKFHPQISKILNTDLCKLLPEQAILLCLPKCSQKLLIIRESRSQTSTLASKYLCYQELDMQEKSKDLQQQEVFDCSEYCLSALVVAQYSDLHSTFSNRSMCRFSFAD